MCESGRERKEESEKGTERAGKEFCEPCVRPRKRKETWGKKTKNEMEMEAEKQRVGTKLWQWCVIPEASRGVTMSEVQET